MTTKEGEGGVKLGDSTVRVWVRFEELWEPWHIHRDEQDHRFHKADVPEALIVRFEAAKAEMDEVWDELRSLMRRD
jgi:hypothetical protein